MVLDVNESRVSQEKSKKVIFDNLRKKSVFYLNKPVLEDLDLYYFVKGFFKEYLGLDKELSFQEIIQEIEKTYIPSGTKSDLIGFINKIEVIEFKDSTFSEDVLKNHIKEFYTIVKSLPFDEVITLGFFDRVKKFLGFKTKEDELTTLDRVEEKIGGVVKKDSFVEESSVVVSDSKGDVGGVVVEEKDVGVLDEGSSEDVKAKLPVDLENVELSDDFTQDVVVNVKKENSSWVEDLDDSSGGIGQDIGGFRDDVSAVDGSSQEGSGKGGVLGKKKKGGLKIGGKRTVAKGSSDKVKSKKSVSEKVSLRDEKGVEGKSKDFFVELKKSVRLKNKGKLLEKYKELHGLYESLSIEDKSKAYPELLKLYEKIAKFTNK